MKKLFPILMMSVLLFVACQPDPIVVPSENYFQISDKGETKTVKIESNFDWTASSDADWITVPSKGLMGESLVIKVAPNKTAKKRSGNVTVTVANKRHDASKTIRIEQTCIGANLTVNYVIDDDPSKSFISASGGKVVFNGESNVEWTCTVDGKNVTVDKTNGPAGTFEVVVTYAPNESVDINSVRITIDAVTESGAVYAGHTIVQRGGVNCHGIIYNVAKLDDGKYWMGEPMRNVPVGLFISDDPSDNSANVFYPYELTNLKTDTTYNSKTGAVSGISRKGTPVALKDDESIAKYGLLYTYNFIFGEEITNDNYFQFEGKQGICPDGWHIPTRDDWFGLCGSSIKAYGEEKAPADDPSAVLYDADYKGASVRRFSLTAFNPVLSGAASVANARSYGNAALFDYNCGDQSWYDRPALTYFACSTGAGSKGMLMAVGTTFTKTYPLGRVSIMQAKAATGCQVRCVKDN